MFRFSTFPPVIGTLPFSHGRYGLRLHLFRMKYCWLAACFLLSTGLALLPWDGEISGSVRAGLSDGRLEFLSELVRVVKVFGKADVLISMALFLGACGLRRQVLEILLALLLVMILVWPVKVTVGRERPRGESFVSFPSGDAASVAAFAVPMVVRAPALLPVAGVIATAVAAGRVLDNAHYPSDVLAGVAFGLIAGGLAVVFSRRWNLKLGGRTLLYCALCYAAVRGGCALVGGGNEFLSYVEVFGPSFMLFTAARYLRIALGRNAAGDHMKEKREEGTHSSWTESFGGILERMGRDRKFDRLVVLLVALSIFGLFLFSTSRSTLWDRDEPRFSRASVEMVQSGDYLVPTFNGALRPDKPILIYWLMSLTLRLFGQSELACRFFAPLGTALACLLVYFAGRRFFRFSPAAALLAMMVVATTPLMTVSGTAATTDGLLLSFMTASIVVFVRAVERGFTRMDVFLLAMALGLAQLLKGPVGLGVPLLVVGTLLWLNRSELPAIRSLSWPLAIAVAVSVGIFLAWAIPANNATGGEFLRKGVGHHVVERAVKPLESHGGSFFLSLPYYLPVIMAGFFPWTLFLPGAVSALIRGKLGSRTERALLIAWVVPPILLMTFVGTKLPHYILPAWPGLALAVAAVVDAAQKGRLAASDSVWLRRGLWLFVPIGAALALVLMVGPWFVPLSGARGACFSLGLLLAVMTFLGSREHLARRYRSAASVLVLGMLLFQIVLATFLLPRLERFKVSPVIAGVITSRTEPTVPVAAYKFDEPSLIFYLDRKLNVLGREEDVAAWARETGPGALVIPREILRNIETQNGRLGLEEIGSAGGYNYTKGRWVNLVALKR
jgi:4-amino-4-deoxy-L-arabinose transferase-like glycosyltransferase/membrane-associated phospholipid phosphatase